MNYLLPGSLCYGHEGAEPGIWFDFPFPCQVQGRSSSIPIPGQSCRGDQIRAGGRDPVLPHVCECVCMYTQECVLWGLHSTLKLFPYLIMAQVSAIRVIH